MGIRFSTKSKKTKIKAFDITFKSVGFRMMTIYQDILRIFIKTILPEKSLSLIYKNGFILIHTSEGVD